MMRTLLAAILVLVLPSAVCAEEPIPTPSVTRIDYSRPQDYVALTESMGTESRIRELAAKLKADTPEETLAAIQAWMNGNLKYDGNVAYSWRTCDDAVASGTYGGCADYAVTFAALARACDIPTVFVKTLDVVWIVNYRQYGIEDSWSGHVFLEVYVGDQWRLLDPQARVVYDDYKPTMRILPGLRYAYDKGVDPRELPLSLDWTRWKKQTAEHFSKFDLNELFQSEVLPPVGMGRKLHREGDVYIAADSPIWQALSERCRGMGLGVQMSFNAEFERYLAEARSGLLLITCVGERIVLPDARHDEFLPLSAADLLVRTTVGESGMRTRRLDDGTRVVLLYAPDVDKMLELVRKLELKDLTGE